MAVSGVLTAIDRVMEGSLLNAFCAVRPPGHHAESNRAMGFCLFNNVAIGARYLQKRHGLKRIFILDWDVHHGNGTQHSFYDDPTVFYFSTHQYPFYPGTGSEAERGAGEGEGTTLNCPLPSGSGDREMLSIFEKELASSVMSFSPDFILLSAGFDAHRDDPLASLQVTDGGFREMTRIVKSLAQTACQGRVVSSLEGGYNLAALARSVGVHLEILSE
jgi:acetoin utilization deacetylase AcuC-like enzyme